MAARELRTVIEEVEIVSAEKRTVIGRHGGIVTLDCAEWHEDKLRGERACFWNRVDGIRTARLPAFCNGHKSQSSARVPVHQVRTTGALREYLEDVEF